VAATYKSTNDGSGNERATILHVQYANHISFIFQLLTVSAEFCSVQPLESCCFLLQHVTGFLKKTTPKELALLDRFRHPPIS